MTIGKKINTLISLLLLVSILGTVFLATHFFTSDQKDLLRKNVYDTSAMISGRIRSEMRAVAHSARMLGAASLEEFSYPEDRLRYIQDNLAINKTTVALTSFKLTKSEKFVPDWRVLHPEVERKYKIGIEALSEIDLKHPLNLKLTSNGTVDFTTAKFENGIPLIRMSIPFVQKKSGVFSKLLVIDLYQEKLASLFAESTNVVSFLMDRSGRILASTNSKDFPLGVPVSTMGVPLDEVQNENQSGALDYRDQLGNAQMAAFQKVGFAGLNVMSQVPYQTLEKAKVKVYRRVGLLSGAFLCFAFALGLIFSKNLTNPIQALAKAAEKVRNGDFSIRLPVRKGRKKGASGSTVSGDEIQQFSGLFNQMVEGLEERDRLRSTFDKFHSKEIAEKLLSGEVQLGGERKSAIVFFSDVRGFTSMSEQMNPEALVTILNRYMTRMVKIIFDYGGVVDKYVGDAIMAIWGAPIEKEDDAANSIAACLEMRKSLAELNEELKNENLPTLKIGMGLNYGPLIAGNIGSEERMEYTVIGDTVNTASRIEALTKSFGTDLLISQSVVNRVPNQFILERTYEVKVKGKSEALVVYKVNGFFGDQGEEILIQTPYSSFEPDKKMSAERETETTDVSSVFPPPFMGTNSGFIRPHSATPPPFVRPSREESKGDKNLIEDDFSWNFETNELIDNTGRIKKPETKEPPPFRAIPLKAVPIEDATSSESESSSQSSEDNSQKNAA